MSKTFLILQDCSSALFLHAIAALRYVYNAVVLFSLLKIGANYLQESGVLYKIEKMIYNCSK